MHCPIIGHTLSNNRTIEYALSNYPTIGPKLSNDWTIGHTLSNHWTAEKINLNFFFFNRQALEQNIAEHYPNGKYFEGLCCVFKN